MESSQSFNTFETDMLLDDPDGHGSATSFSQLSDLSSFQCVSTNDAGGMQQNIGGAVPGCTQHDTTLDSVGFAASEQIDLSRVTKDDHTAQHAYEAACMLAAMLGAAGRKLAMVVVLGRASEVFQRMCQFHSPAVLTAPSFVLTWLLVHAEGSFPEKIMAASLAAATEALGPNNPVNLLLEWMTAAAARDKLRTCRIGVKELRTVWQGFHHTLGEAHGHTIVALYCLSLHMILADKQFSEAEQYLQKLSLVSTNVFGLSCVLTINILATLSRAQHRQGKYLLALATIDRSLAAAPLGLNHPHRLQLLLRKALILRRLDRWEETEALYWIVVRGRMATLGWQHKDTIAAHNSLVWVLQEQTGNWEARRDDVQRLLVDPQVSVDEYESWWRRFKEENKAPVSGGQDSSDDE